MEIYDALIIDHRKLQDLLEQLLKLKDDDEELRHELVQQIRDELVPHSRAEEAVFYNSIRAINTAQDLVWDGFKEHMEAEALLRTLQAADKVDAGWRETARKLKQAINHHIQEEENRIIPTARQLFTNDEAEVMADASEDMKPHVADGSIIQATLDLIANMMPPRLAAPLRTYTYRV